MPTASPIQLILLHCLAGLSHFERGQRRVAPNLLAAMAQLCDVSVHWCFRDALVGESAARAQDEEICAHFLALPEARDMMGTFARIHNWESWATAMTLARMFASPAKR